MAHIFKNISILSPSNGQQVPPETNVTIQYSLVNTSSKLLVKHLSNGVTIAEKVLTHDVKKDVYTQSFPLMV